MKAITNWNYTPYMRYHETKRATLPHICRVAPKLGGFLIEWFDKGAECPHKIIINKRTDDKDTREYELSDAVFEISDLAENETYEVTVWRSDMSEHSDTRLVRTGFARGTVLNYIHPEDHTVKYSGVCPGSPSIVALPSGKLLAAMDILLGDTDEKLTFIYESTDHGETWKYVTELYPCHWGKLFYHRGKLYCCGEGGSCLLLGCSEDEGKTWSTPIRLMQGARRDWAIHKSVNPFVEYDGRIWTAIEYGSWKFHCYYHMLLSAPADSDLMNPENWVFSEPAKVNLGEVDIDTDVLTGAEGNAVAMPFGICDVLRVDPSFKNPEGSYKTYNVAMVRLGDSKNPEAPLVHNRVINIPCGLHNKFIMMKEPTGLGYVMIGNEYTEEHKLRSLLTLAVSKDGVNWKNALRIVDARPDETPDKKDIAYSDPDMAFDGEDIVLVTRTASNGAMDFHNNNMVCFFKVENYKQYFT